MANVLYVSYDGIMEPLGQSQVFQYLKRLAKEQRIILISYEKVDDWKDHKRRYPLQDKVKEAGIYWIPLRYHKTPAGLATAYDIVIGYCVSVYLVFRNNVQIVHARSYVPSVIALVIKKMFDRKFIFDMRGFWADERVERGIWPCNSRLYQIAKWFERKFFLNADVVVSLTHAGSAAIRTFEYLGDITPRVEVITTCTDLDTFQCQRLGLSEDGFTFGYVGSTDTAYLFEPVLECFKILLSMRSSSRLLIVTHSDHDRIRTLLAQHMVPVECIEIKSVPHDLVVREICKMDAGIFFVKTGFSSLGSMPTKLGEFLACGVPCLVNAGVGDVEGILEGEKVGVVLRDFSREAQNLAVFKLLELVSDHETRSCCVEVAKRYFSVERGAASYDRIYRSLAV